MAFIGLVSGLVAVPSLVRAGEMDPALGRLRLVGGEAGCSADPVDGYCPDEYSFERLAAELATTLAPPLTTPARTLGPRGFGVALDTTVTSISGSDTFWSRGTEGADEGATFNEAPMGVMVWNRLGVRKGLPFGFELGASAAHAANSSMFTLGIDLKWAVLEGFHSGLGAFPDLAIRGAFQQQLGSDQLSVKAGSVDVVLSKPFVLGAPWVLSPLLAVQTLLLRAESAVVDLTPEVDALAECAPLPGHQPDMPGGAQGSTIACTGDGSDFQNNAAFQPMSQTRVRLALGAELRREWLTLATSFAVDLMRPDVDAVVTGNQDSKHARQFAFTFAVGARY